MKYNGNVAGWSSVLRFTKSNKNYGHLGDRTIALFVRGDRHFCIVIEKQNDHNWHKYTGSKLVPGTTYKVEI